MRVGLLGEQARANTLPNNLSDIAHYTKTSDHH
jgi:hypothetical protein